LGKIDEEQSARDSICPICNLVIPAKIYEEDGKVYITKTCQEHGEVTDLYWGDYEEYIRAQGFEHLGAKLENPQTETRKGCPYDCGICPEHKSHTVLALIDVTNRCNLKCPICFTNAGQAGYLYEPSKEQIREMMVNLLKNKPVPPPAIQFTGGEPTVRDDLPELIKMAMDMGFVHSQVSSNGLKMAESVEYCHTLKKAELSTVYLQFDGVTSEPYIRARGLDLLDVKLRAISNLREAGFMSIVLVPVLMKGVNDDQVGDIIRFAIDHKDCVRCVNFQPVSITGRIKKEERESMRITIPDLIQLAEEQTGGLIKRNDWYPVSATGPFCQFLSNAKEEKFVDLSPHPHCGVGAYLFIDGEKVTPLSDHLNIEDLLKSVEAANLRLEQGKTVRARLTAVSWILRNIKFRQLYNFISLLIYKSDYHSLDRLHHRMILISSMHFMDTYNFDLERVQRCVIHYAVPDGRIIPFCTMNNFHREEIEKKFSKPIKETTKSFGKR
jgi:uncharacterized radical SAM superfamily Fe-S cluster-containing enzyme